MACATRTFMLINELSVLLMRWWIQVCAEFCGGSPYFGTEFGQEVNFVFRVPRPVVDGD